MTERPTRRGQRPVLALSLMAFAGGLGGGVVFPILPVLGLQLGISAGLIGLILSLNRITRLGASPITGMLVDRFGPRWPLIAGLATEGVSTLAFYVGVHGAHPAAWFLVGRGLWGVGSSLLMVGALTAALLVSEAGSRGRTSARVRMSLSLGMPGGLALGGLITARFSPGAAFLTAAAIGLIGAVIAWRYAPAGRSQPAPERPETSNRQVLGLLLADRRLWGIWAFNFLVFLCVQGVVLATLVLLIRERAITLPGLGIEGTAGLLMALMIGMSVAVSWLIGKRIDRVGRSSASLPLGATSLLLGFVGLALGGQFLTIALALLLIGLALGAINIPLILLLGDWVASHHYGRAFGVYQLLGDLGGSIGPILGLEALTRWNGQGLFLALAGLLALTIPLGLWLVRGERRRLADPG